MSSRKAYESDSESTLFFSKLSFVLYTRLFVHKWIFSILTNSCMFIHINTKWSGYTDWVVSRPSKRTNWIKKQFHGFGYFWVPSERWKETAPWKRKFRFSVKVNIYLKPCMHPKSKNVNIENKGAAGKNFWTFEILHFKMGKWT